MRHETQVRKRRWQRMTPLYSTVLIAAFRRGALADARRIVVGGEVGYRRACATLVAQFAADVPLWNVGDAGAFADDRRNLGGDDDGGEYTGSDNRGDNLT
jgi:hypothetical protein